MRTLLTLGVLVATLAVAGCKSNGSAGNMLGSTDPAGLTSGTLTATPPTPVPGFYGVISNLDLGAGTFTLTSPSGATSSITISPSAMVLYKGTTSSAGTSALANGEQVTVSGQVSGLTSHAHVVAQLIIINLSDANQAIIAPSAG